MTYKFVFFGEAPGKKNEYKESWTRKDKKTGKFLPLDHPIKYYTPTYYEWAWKAIEYLLKWKKRHEDLEFPLQGQYVATCLFYRCTPINLTGEKGKGKGRTIDLQNLYDTVLDTLAGNSGVRIPKKMEAYMDHHSYQILKDDSFAFIKSHDGSHIFFDPNNPRTEVYLSDFKLENLAKVMKLHHPDAVWDTGEEQQQPTLFAPTNDEDQLKRLLEDI